MYPTRVKANGKLFTCQDPIHRVISTVKGTSHIHSRTALNDIRCQTRVWQVAWGESEFLKAGLSNGLAHPFFFFPSEGLTKTFENYQTWLRSANCTCPPNGVRNTVSCSRGASVSVPSLTELFIHHTAT